MKNIDIYIKESLEEFSVNNVKVVYNCEPSELIFQVPKGYSESDIQIYIGDSFYKFLPADANVGKKYFGKNLDFIADAYFEYDAFVPLEANDYVDKPIPWDAHGDADKKAPELIQIKLVNMTYKILFDTFVIKKSENDDITKILDKIFAMAESSAVNKYPITIKYDKDKLEFTEQ